MKQGKTLQELAAEVQRQAEIKKDYLVSPEAMMMDEAGNHIRLQEFGRFDIAKLFHRQLAENLNIPFRYYELMQQNAPILLANNVNHWLSKPGNKRLVRTLDRTARAYLSNRYRTLDNYDLLEAVLPKLSSLKLEVKSCEVTETRLYLKCTTEEIIAQAVGDTICAGVIIVNSEVGYSSLRVEPFTLTLSCKNGMTHTNYGLKKYHIGRGSGDDSPDAREFFKDDTLQAEDKAFFKKVRDVVEATLSTETFHKIIATMNNAAKLEITGGVAKVVEVTAKQFSFSQTEQDSVLSYLAKGGNLNAYGLGQAITRTSQDATNYDRASDLEQIGGQIIEISPREWAEMNS